MSRRKMTDEMITQVIAGGHTKADPGQIALVRILAGEVADLLDNIDRIAVASERIATALEQISISLVPRPDDGK